MGNPPNGERHQIVLNEQTVAALITSLQHLETLGGPAPHPLFCLHAARPPPCPRPPARPHPTPPACSAPCGPRLAAASSWTFEAAAADAPPASWPPACHACGGGRRLPMRPGTERRPWARRRQRRERQRLPRGDTAACRRSRRCGRPRWGSASGSTPRPG